MELLVLKIQHKLLSFLVQFYKLILHDLPPESLTSQSVPVQPEPLFPMDKTKWSSLAVVAAETTYQVPARLDLKQLQAIISAKRSEAEHHI